MTAYQSPNTGDAIALVANFDESAAPGRPDVLGVVDLTKMLALPSTGNVCNATFLPASVVTLISPLP